MFDVTKIQTNLYGVVGLRQPLNPTYAILDAANQISRSGEFVDSNPYCKVEFLHDNQDYSAISDADFNTKLKELQEDAIVNVCNGVFNKPDFIDRKVLFKFAQNRISTEVETLPDGFVCHKIRVSGKMNIAFEIKRVLLDFNGAGDIELMLFNTSQDAPIESQIITISSTHQATELNWKVDNSGDTYKGEYYLGYLSNYVGIGTLQPFKRDYENSDIQANITHLDIDRYNFPAHATNVLPDLEIEKGIDESIGVNPDITVYDDFTDQIIQNETLLGHAINLATQINCIEFYMASLRSNLHERQSQLNLTRLISVVEGSSADSAVVVTGLRPQLSRAISNIKKEINKLHEGYFGNRGMVDTLE